MKVIIVEIANRVIKGMLYMYIQTTQYPISSKRAISPPSLVHLLFIASLPFFMVTGLSPRPDALSAVSVL